MRGTIHLPGDKSISHRVAMLASLAVGSCRLTNFNSGADCASTLDCLSRLGIGIHRKGGTVQIEPAPMSPPAATLNCGNSGSTIRMLTGLLAGQNIAATLAGDLSLLKRPMRRLAEPLRQMGAIVHLREDEFAPVILEQGVLRAVQYQMPVSSAQVKSAILLAGLRFPGTSVLEPVPTRDHTERLLAHLAVESGREISPFDYNIPADPSSAAFFVVGALLNPGSEIVVPGLLVNPHRVAYLHKLREAGALIEISHERMIQNEPVADVSVKAGVELRAIVIEPREVPSMIDEIPVLSLLGTVAGFSVRGAKELRYKESDRIHAMVSNLRALGAVVTESEDGYSVEPGKLYPGKAATFGDHRIAMTFAIAGMDLDDHDCVSISFPEFFSTLCSL